MTIYRNTKAKESLANITEALIEKLPYKGLGQGHTVETSIGKSYCLELGNPNLPKLAIFHGGYTNHSFILYYLRSLIKDFHIFAFDMPGHPGKSSEVVLDPRDDSYGKWAIEAIEAIGIKQASFLGLSYGGFVCQRVAAMKPNLVDRLILVVSAGICPMNQLSLMRALMFPQILFTLTKKEFFLNSMMNGLFTDYDDELVVDFFRDMLLYVKTDQRQMKLSRKEEFANFSKPVLLLTAEKDVVFDCNRQEKEAVKLFPNLEVQKLMGQKHSPSVTESGRNFVCELISDFIMKDEAINEYPKKAES